MSSTPAAPGAAEPFAKSIERLEVLLGQIADGVTVQDQNGRLIYANDAAARLAGLESAHEMLTLPVRELVDRFELLDEHGAPLPPERLPGRVALAQGKSAEETIRYRIRTTGEERWSLVRATPILNGVGVVEAAVNVFHDVTSSKRAEAGLRFLAEASELLSQSLDYDSTLARVARLAVPRVADWCMVYMLEPDGSIARLAVEHAGGLHLDVLQRLGGREFDRDAEVGVPAVLRTGRAQLHADADSRLVAADVLDPEELVEELESLGIVSWMCVPLVARDRTIGAISLLSAESRRRFDESDLALAQELARHAALAVDNARLYRTAHETAASLDTLLSAAPVGLGFWDRDLRYVRINDALAEMNGLPVSDHLGRTVEEVLPDLGPGLAALWRGILETGEPLLDVEIEGETPARPGVVRHWLANYYPVTGDDGEAIGLGGIVIEITDRKHAEAELEQARRRLEFLAEVGRVLAGLVDHHDTLARMPSLCVPRLADACAVYVPDTGDEALVRAAHAHSEADPFSTSLAPRYDIAGGADAGEPVVRAFLDRRPQLLSRLPAGSLESARRDGSAMILPLEARGRCYGVLTLSSHQSGRHGATDFSLAQELTGRVALALDRSRLFEEARESYALVDTLLARAPVGLAFFDPQLRFARVNDAFAEIAGIAASDHVGRTVGDVLPTLGHRMSEDMRRVVTTGEPVLGAEVAGEAGAQPGVTRSWLTSYYPVRDETGTALGLGAVLVETTAAKHAEEERAQLLDAERRARTRLEFLAEASRVLASSLDYEATLRQVARLAVPELADWCALDTVGEDGSLKRLAVAHSDPAKELFASELAARYPPDPDATMGPLHVARTGEPELVPELTDEMIEAAAQDDEHLAMLRELGFTSYLCVPLHTRREVAGVLTFVSAESGRHYDETDLALAEELARRAAVAIENARLYGEARRRARAVQALRFVGDGVVLLDGEGVVRLWNPAAEVITGLSAQDVLGRAARDAVPGWGELAPRVPLGGRPETLPLELEGRELWLSIAGVGFPAGSVYTFRDMTEELALERMKTDFVSTVSHELRTPLAAIYGAAQTLRREDVELGDSQRADLVTMIAGEAERLARIVSDILWASRLESGVMHVSIESCDAGEIAEGVVRAARLHLPPDVTIELEAPVDPPAVAGDSDKVRQVLANLVENAVKYAPGGGPVEVALELRAGTMRFAVMDRGLGIPPAERERVFEKFFRLDPNLTRGVGGTGLGLYICRELVTRMGGRVWIEARAGGGSTFAFELPLAEPSPRPGR